MKLLMRMMKILSLISLTLTRESLLLLGNFWFCCFHVSSKAETDQDTESDEEPDWEAEYETLFKKTMKMVKVNEKSCYQLESV